jgi:hypothetical protein
MFRGIIAVRPYAVDYKVANGFPQIRVFAQRPVSHTAAA